MKGIKKYGAKGGGLKKIGKAVSRGIGKGGGMGLGKGGAFTATPATNLASSKKGIF